MTVTYLNLLGVFLLLRSLPVCTIIGKNNITCTEREVNTSKYVVTYTVERRWISLDYGCQFENYSSMWPSRPEHLNVSQFGQTLKINWTPPNDGSISILTGFLIEIYDESPEIFNMNPEVCYTATLSTSLKNEQFGYSVDRYFAQNAVFSLNCVVHGHKATPYRIFLTPLPMPASDSRQDIDMGFDYTAYVSSTSGTTLQKTVDGFPEQGATRILETDDLLKIVAICAGCFFLVVINAILIFMMCRIKRFRDSKCQRTRTSAATRLVESGYSSDT